MPLEELRSHLRDEVEHQMKSGLDEQEVFNSAVQKIGQAHMIQNEFKKVEVAKEAGHWKLMQIVFVAFSSLFPLMIASQLFYFKTGSASQMTPGQKLSCLAAIMTFPLLAWGGRLSCGILPAIQAKRIRDIIHCLCAVIVSLWWIGFLRIIVPRYDFTLCQFVVTFLWAFIVPGGVLIGLPWGIESAARRKITTDLSAGQS